MSYVKYCKYIEEKLPAETPLLFGLHPNAEISFLTNQGSNVFKTILDLQGGGGSRADGGKSKEDVVALSVQNFLKRLPDNFNMITLAEKARDRTPYVVVALQECERMNILLDELRRTLQELQLGLEGALNISDAMEALSTALFLNRVPKNWEKYAYFSLKSLGSWFNDLLDRVTFLNQWTVDLNLPASVWLPGLFNPKSFLTAVMQTTARKFEYPLDNMTIETHATTMMDPASVQTAPETGVYIHGLYLEGARWDTEKGVLRDSFLKELYPAVPVVWVKSVKLEEKVKQEIYECPVYVTSQRGPTFVFTATMKTKDEPHKWILGGVALLMSLDD
eukprot:GILJ01033111.1.p1 GENE.GILJ01033111.1~~GILJ01033111.1.p1  ORF type:complete len:344 (-),score=47.18 GILJ01033111.1:90-1091(-)